MYNLNDNAMLPASYRIVFPHRQTMNARSELTDIAGGALGT